MARRRLAEIQARRSEPARETKPKQDSRIHQHWMLLRDTPSPFCSRFESMSLSLLVQ